MRKKRKKIDIEGGWFPVSKCMLKSKAFMALSNKSKVAYLYFLNNIKKDEQNIVSMTLNKLNLRD